MVTFITAIFERLSDMEKLQLKQRTIEVQASSANEQDLQIHSLKLPARKKSKGQIGD